MKNKLLVSTALGAVMLSGAVNAETKITGQLDINYSAASSNVSATSTNGWGRESQLNVSNSGDLSNGMKYAAGFSFEFDGALGTAVADENLYIDITSGNTTVGVSQDHGLNTDSSAVPRVSINAGSLSTFDVAYAQGAAIGLANHLGHVKEGMGVTIAQKMDIGAIQFRYTPELLQDGGVNDGATKGAEGSAYDINFQGNAGVDGLNVNLAYAKADKAGSSAATPSRDAKGVQYGIGYNFGQVSVGAQVSDRELGTSATAEKKTTEFGATFAATDSLSLGVAVANTDVNGGTADEEIVQATIGYNLGAVAIHLNYADYQNVGGTRGTDYEVGSVRLSTKF